MLKYFVALAIMLACEAMPSDLGSAQSNFTTCVTPAHYCMIVDSSNSIFTDNGNTLWENEKGVIRNVAEGIDIGPGTNKSKVALVKFGGEVKKEFDFNITDKGAVLNAITDTVRLSGTASQGTVTPEAIRECVRILKEQGQDNIPKVIMLFSDGVTHYPRHHKFFRENRERQELTNAVAEAVSLGTINYAVIFPNKPDMELVKRAQQEAAIITSNNTERAIVGESLDAIEEAIITTLACVCTENITGQIRTYAVGQPVPNSNPCQSCTCMADNTTTCEDISGTCPPPPSCPPGTNHEEVNVAGQCCPNYTACTGSCTANGTPYAVGDSVPSTDPCMMCTCTGHQNITCTTTVCPQLECADQLKVPDVCCPRCPDPCEPTHYCLVLDSSRSIFETDNKLTNTLWTEEKDVAHKVVDGLAIGPSESNSKVALVTYAASVKRVFTFQQNIKKAFLLTAIEVLPPLQYVAGEGKGGTATPEAIKECLAIFREESRPDMPKKIVVFTDGRTHYYDYINTPELSRARLVGAVKEATDAGVTNYAVVFRSDSDQDKAMQEATIIAQNVTERRFHGETPSKITSVLHCRESKE